LLVPTIFPVDPDSSIVVDDPVLNSLVDIPFAGVTSHPVLFEYTNRADWSEYWRDLTALNLWQ
jgi:hypothetical protein